MRMTHPGRKYEPSWRAEPSWISAEALVTGPGSHPHLVPPKPLRVLRDCLGDWSWYGVWNRSWNWGLLLSLWGTESDPWSEAGPTSGANHIYSLYKRTQRQGKAVIRDSGQRTRHSRLVKQCRVCTQKLEQGSDGPHQPLPVEWRLGKAKESSAGLSQGTSGTG